jgi:hypothetical protein
MLIRLIVVVLLIIWASDKEKALGPALVYAGITLGFGILLHAGSGSAAIGSALVQTVIDFTLAFGLFWLVARTGGVVGWLVRAVTIVVLGGVATFLFQVLGK